MKQRRNVPRLGNCSRPREFFRLAQSYAIRIRKLLRRLRAAERAWSVSGLMDDADTFCDLIEKISRRGIGVSAEEAIELSEMVDRLIELLVIEINTLLMF